MTDTINALSALLGIDANTPTDAASPMVVDHVRNLIDENRRLREMIAVRAETGAPVVRIAVTFNANRETEMGMVVTARTGAERELAQFAAAEMTRQIQGLVPDWDSARTTGTPAMPTDD